MKNISIILFLLILYFTENAFGQYIVAGLHGTQDYYFDIVPDTTITAPQNVGGIHTFTYEVDVNNDAINDFILNVTADDFGHWHHYEICTVTPLNNNKVAYWGLDSCFSSIMCPPVYFYYGVQMADAFSAGDTINKNNIWTSSSANLAHSQWAADLPDPCGYSCNGTTFPSTSKYLGLKVFIPNDTLYGWIQVKSIASNNMTIQEYACNTYSTNNVENYPIKSSIIISPNPSNGKFTITNQKAGIKIDELRICNLAGEQIYCKKIQTAKTTVNLSDKPKGIYFMKMEIENHRFTYKIIIE